MLIKEKKIKFSQKHRSAVYDFTIPMESCTDPQVLMTALLEFCKLKSSFQGEKGKKTGFKHWQGRISTNKKWDKSGKAYIWDLIDHTKDNPIFKGVRWSITNNKCTKGPLYWDYITKDHTRIDGPYRLDRDSKRAEELQEQMKEPLYIPKHLRNFGTLKPFQQSIIDLSKMAISIYNNAPEQPGPHARGLIRYIYNPEGSTGKSTIKDLMECHMGAISLPTINDQLKLIQTAENIFRGYNMRKSTTIFFDMPRAQDDKTLYGLYNAIETILGCKVYDLRNKYREWRYDLPVLWVFSNQKPKTELMSGDRWRLFHINKKDELVLGLPKEKVQSSNYEPNNFGDLDEII